MGVIFPYFWFFNVFFTISEKIYFNTARGRNAAN
jgi:hypothetical protein